MDDVIKQLPTILITVGIVVAMIFLSKSLNKTHQKRRYEAKVKAGFIKAGEELVVESEEEKQKKMRAALDLAKSASKKPEDGKESREK